MATGAKLSFRYFHCTARRPERPLRRRRRTSIMAWHGPVHRLQGWSGRYPRQALAGNGAEHMGFCTVLERYPSHAVRQQYYYLLQAGNHSWESPARYASRTKGCSAYKSPAIRHPQTICGPMVRSCLLWGAGSASGRLAELGQKLLTIFHVCQDDEHSAVTAAVMQSRCGGFRKDGDHSSPTHITCYTQCHRPTHSLKLIIDWSAAPV